MADMGHTHINETTNWYRNVERPKNQVAVEKGKERKKERRITVTHCCLPRLLQHEPQDHHPLP